MDISYIFSAGIFVQLALLFYVLGLLTRNELLLRVQILIGTACYIIYYYFIGDTPLWDAIWASGVIGVANLIMIIVVLRERSTMGMSAQMLEIYRFFPTLKPGQFRKIMKFAVWIKAEEDTQLSKRGEYLDSLFLVTHGEVILRNNTGDYAIAEGSFIGEISFLIDGPATASVMAPKDVAYIRWDRKKLVEQMNKSLRLSNAISALFNIDIAHKLARSGPISGLSDINHEISYRKSS